MSVLHFALTVVAVTIGFIFAVVIFIVGVGLYTKLISSNEEDDSNDDYSDMSYDKNLRKYVKNTTL